LDPWRVYQTDPFEKTMKWTDPTERPHQELPLEPPDPDKLKKEYEKIKKEWENFWNDLKNSFSIPAPCRK
jgi:hypothetical protein